MMKEINLETLHAALNRLPNYAPPEAVWEHIDLALEMDADIRNSVEQLPQFEPPIILWENIATQLPLAPKVARRISLWPRYAAAAAMVGVLFGAWWLLHPDTTVNSTEQIVVTQETMDTQIIATVQERDDKAFEWVQNLCAARAPICEQPEFKSLKSELEELTAAKQQIHEALGQYGDDPDLANKLVQIEITRTQLLQEIMQLI